MKTYHYLLIAGCMLQFACTGKEQKAEATQEQAQETTEEATNQDDDRGYLVKVNDMAPDFSMTLTDGKTVRLSELRGKVVMLQFTASWCSVCLKEMPFIEKDIWKKYKNNADFALFGIDRDEPVEKANEMIQRTGITYSMGLDPGADIFALYADRQAGITRNVIVDREGRIVMLTRLFNEEEFAAMCKKIDELLSNK